MCKTPCKSVKRDGTPCQGHGLEQYDGYCIAHVPAHIARPWRVRGGENSSTAARRDKRIPEHLKDLLTQLTDGLAAVRAGTLEPAAYNAMCRGVKTILDLHRIADKEMDVIRAEEIETAAAEVVGVHGDLDILAAAAEINDRQTRYHHHTLVAQGLAKLETPSGDNQPPQAVLTPEGRRRFGERRATGYTQEDIDEVRNAAENYECQEDELPELLENVAVMTDSFEATLADLAHQADRPRDPFTGEPAFELPPGLKRDDLTDHQPPRDPRTPETLTEQLNQHKQLHRAVDALIQDPHYSTKRNLFQSGRDLDTVTIVTKKKPPTIDHPPVPQTRN